MMNVMYVKCMVHPKILCLNYHRPSTVEQIERQPAGIKPRLLCISDQLFTPIHVRPLFFFLFIYIYIYFLTCPNKRGERDSN
jgi:hypothetical protein